MLRPFAWLSGAFLVAPLLAAACGGTTADHSATPPDGGTDAAMHDGSQAPDGEAGTVAPDGAAGCEGTAPNCFGTIANECCGHDPFNSATCVGGQWMCGQAEAPGCNGILCGTPACPSTAPATGSTCNLNGPSYVCSYGQGCAQCECSIQGAAASWSCADACADGGATPCPASPPSRGSACETDGITCDYTSGGPQACTCHAMGGWSCVPVPYPDGGIEHP